MEQTRADRFDGSSSSLAGNRFEQLKKERAALREAAGQDAPRELKHATRLIGTCETMCPEFEREEREYQNSVDKLEFIPGTRRIDPARAVKVYQRSAAGMVYTPADVRPPRVLKKTLDYLFHTILASDPNLEHAHPFLRDRARAVRKDFTIQGEKGPIAIECNERVARFHIYSLHVMQGRPSYDEAQELEQLRKVLQTLSQLYDDARRSKSQISCPNEPEFRAYAQLIHLRDPDQMRAAEMVPLPVFQSPQVQQACRLQSLIQRSNASLGSRTAHSNSEASLNGFSRFFKLVASPECTFLTACLLQLEFDDIRSHALKAMRRGYISRNPDFPLDTLTDMLGCDDVAHCASICEQSGLDVANNRTGEAVAVKLHKQSDWKEYMRKPSSPRPSKRLVESKRGTASVQDIVDGLVQSHFAAPAAPKLSPVDAASTEPLRIQPKAPQAPSAFFPLAHSTNTSTPVLPPQQTPAALQFTSTLFPPSPRLERPSPVGNDFFAPSPTTPLSVPVSPAPQTTPTRSFPLEQALQPDVPTSKAPMSPTLGKQPSPKKPTLVKQQSPKSSHASKRAKQIDLVAAKLAASLIQNIVQQATHTAAVQAIEQVRQDEAAQATRRQDQFLQGVARRLAEHAIELEIAKAIVKQRADQHRLRAFFCKWRAHLDRRKNGQKQWAERIASIRRAASELGQLFQPPELDGFDGTDISMLSIAGEQEMDLDEKAAAVLEQGADEAQAYWAPGTFLRVLQDNIHARSALRLDVLVFVSDIDGIEAKWLRTKFGFQDLDAKQEVIEVQAARIKITFMDPGSLMTENLDQVGMLLFNVAWSNDKNRLRKLERQFNLLQQRCRREAALLPNLLVVYWPPDEEAAAQAYNEERRLFQQHASAFAESYEIVLQLATADQDFCSVLPSLTTTRLKNTNQIPAIPVTTCLRPFFESWASAVGHLADEQPICQGEDKAADLALRLVLILLSAVARTVEAVRKIPQSSRLVFNKQALNLPRRKSLPRLVDELGQQAKLLGFSEQTADEFSQLAKMDDQEPASIFLYFSDLILRHIGNHTSHAFRPSAAFHSELSKIAENLEIELNGIIQQNRSAANRKRKQRSSQPSTPPSTTAKKPRPTLATPRHDDWLPDNLAALRAVLAR